MLSNPNPDGWTEMTFGEMAEQISERVDDPKKAGVDVYVGLEHLDPEDLRIRRRGTPDDVEATKLRVRPGQIIFGKRRAYQRKVAVADFDGIASAHAMILQEKPVLYPGFLPFFMQSDTFMDRAVTISEGGLSPTIKWKTLAAEKFLLPPPEQQRELVELMQGFERAIEAGEETKRSVELLFEQMTDAEFWASDHQKEFCRLGDGVILQLESGISKSTSDDGSGFGVLMLTAFGKFDFVEGETKPASASEFIESKRLRDGDFLISRANLKERTAAIFRDNGNHVMFSDLAMRAELGDNVVPRYLLHLLNSKQGRSRLSRASASSSTGGMVKINKTSLRNVEIRLPQVETQKKIVTNLEDIYTQLIGLEKHVKLISQLRFSILNTALSPSAMAEAAAEVPA